MKNKHKKCKGTGKAKGHGCGELKYIHAYGLCSKCFANWLYNSEEGKAKMGKKIKSAKSKVKKELKQTRKYVKWFEKDTKDMINYVQDNIVNPYIRLRDIENNHRCISSNGVIEHAGHYHSVGSCAGLRFNIMNIHGQSHSANTFKHGDFDNYTQGLINRFGESYLKEISKHKIRADRNKILDRFDVIRIGKTYEYLTKQRIWCYYHEEFENYKNIINK